MCRYVGEGQLTCKGALGVMNHVIFLSNVAPGPACSIPDEKKIFRISADETAAQHCDEPATDGADGDAARLPLPVPHMYSA